MHKQHCIVYNCKIIFKDNTCIHLTGCLWGKGMELEDRRYKREEKERKRENFVGKQR